MFRDQYTKHECRRSTGMRMSGDEGAKEEDKQEGLGEKEYCGVASGRVSNVRQTIDYLIS